MLFIDRPDGIRENQAHSLNAVMPYMMRGRNESAIYYEKTLDVEHALRLVRKKNSGQNQENGDSGRYSLFALLLAAIVRTIALRPELNRFIHRYALYRRKYLALSFIVKQKLSEDAPEGSAKIYFGEEDSLSQVTAKVSAAIENVQSGGSGSEGEKIAQLAHRLPGGKAAIIGLYRLLDRFNLAPKALIESDPLYVSAYVANLGSLGLDAPYHHLYEWGNASFFVVLGKLGMKDGHHVMDVKVTLDERIADGLYFARSASVFMRLIGRPELLEMPLSEARAILSGKVE
jgi:hypothetical protein